MIRAFWEVVKDLWQFVFSSNTDFAPDKQNVKLINEDLSVLGHRTSQKTSLSTTGVVMKASMSSHSHGRPAYVAVDRSFCFSAPEISFDTKIATLLYGDRVEVTELKGELVRVEVQAVRGWMRADELSDDYWSVYPKLAPGYVYDQTDQETLKLRRLLQDETLGHHLEIPLQGLEFILFKLRLAEVVVHWPNVRPREAGAWQPIFRGSRDTALGVTPRTGAVLEYAGNGTPGFLGYVEAVSPDQTITVSTVGRIEPGEYRVEEFTVAQWKEWRPTFISFS